MARLDRDRESREVWPCLSRQRREPEINKRVLGRRFRHPRGPVSRWLPSKNIPPAERLFRRGWAASKGKDKQARSEDFSAALSSSSHPSRRVYTRKCTRRGEGRDLQKIYSTARRTRGNVTRRTRAPLGVIFYFRDKFR